MAISMRARITWTVWLGIIGWGLMTAGLGGPAVAQPAQRKIIIFVWDGVCTENSIRVDNATESPNLSGDDRPVLPLLVPLRLAVQVEEST